MSAAGRFAVILPAAGKSARFGGELKKPFLLLAGLPVWMHSAALFAQREEVRQILLVLAAEDRETFQNRFGEQLRVTLAPGGAERFESVANALALVASDMEYVAIHDAARPCLTHALIERVFARARVTGAAMAAIPMADTIKRADGAGQVESTLPRQGLWLAQTPQVFRRDWLAEAYAAGLTRGVAFTDDAQLLEAAGRVVHLVPGSPTNLKITSPEDFTLAEAILRSRAEYEAKP